MALGARGIRIYKVSSIEYQCRAEECVVEAAARLFLPEWTDRCMMYLWQLCPVLGRRKCERIRRDVHTVTAQTLLTSWAWLMAFIENIGQGRVVSGHQDHQGTTTTNWDELGSSQSMFYYSTFYSTSPTFACLYWTLNHRSTSSRPVFNLLAFDIWLQNRVFGNSQTFIALLYLCELDFFIYVCATVNQYLISFQEIMMVRNLGKTNLIDSKKWQNNEPGNLIGWAFFPRKVSS